jgi:two-component system, chemotaxis family, protein-glutamate methylesterase/glutaminase
MIPTRKASAFPLICIGGASTDIETYLVVLERLSPDLGAAIVIVHHLTMIAEVLTKSIPLRAEFPTFDITEGLVVQPNNVYILTEDRDLHVLDGAFHRKGISKPTGWPNLITVFLESLVENWRGKLIVVILSGYSGDGSQALSEINRVGGTVIVQKVDTAEQPDMPLSAIATGYTDSILPPRKIAAEIERSCRRYRGRRGESSEAGFE